MYYKPAKRTVPIISFEKSIQVPAGGWNGVLKNRPPPFLVVELDTSLQTNRWAPEHQNGLWYARGVPSHRQNRASKAVFRATAHMIGRHLFQGCADRFARLI
jgi:hypothetical protein